MKMRRPRWQPSPLDVALIPYVSAVPYTYTPRRKKVLSMQTDPTQTPPPVASGRSVAEIEAELNAAREAEAVKAADDAKVELTLEGLDARLSDVERRLAGGAAE